MPSVGIPQRVKSQEAIGEKRKLGGEDAAGNAAGDAAGDAKRAKGKATWRKYGQKTLKGKEYVGMRVLRCYYRCNFPGCTVSAATLTPRAQSLCI